MNERFEVEIGRVFSAAQQDQDWIVRSYNGTELRLSPAGEDWLRFDLRCDCWWTVNTPPQIDLGQLRRLPRLTEGLLALLDLVVAHEPAGRAK